MAILRVISVKPSEPGLPGRGIQPMSSGQGYIVGGVPVRLMIKLMYKITDSQIVGGPKWMDTDLWDIQAKADRKYTLDEL
ncbi:MAG: TIGR03435 family protein, partial [Bryobacteraceae bacterium]